MRLMVATGALVLALLGPAYAQQASSDADAQKAPGMHPGTNAQTDVSAPSKESARDTTGAMSSEKQRAPSHEAGTNAQQSKDPSRDPIQSGTHAGSTSK